jgi:transcriptional regulator with XRE-family HTH domain
MSAEFDTGTSRVPWQELLDWLFPEMRIRSLTASELARGAGVPLSTLSGVLNGKHRPSLETLDRLARYLGRPLSELRQLADSGSVEVSAVASIDLSRPRLQELGWILSELAPQLTPEELEGFVDYARYLRDRKRRERRATGE